MSKLLAGAALVSALAFAPTAVAQTQGSAEAASESQCGDLPPAPSLPDGASANNSAMEQGNAAYAAWGQRAQAALACQRSEAERFSQIASERVARYNAGVARLGAVTQAWEDEVSEYNERGGRRQD